MNIEIDINKMNKSITFQNRGIGFTQLGIAKEILDLIDDLQQENKQLKEEKPYLYTNTAWEDILEYQGKSYIELDRFKKLQQELENDIDRYEDTISYQLGYDSAKAFYEKILTELEEYCKSWKENEKYCYLASNDKDKCRYDIWGEVLDKIQELKEKYK